jgi:membrane protein implicated in regulation of membrane protease activity
MYMGWLTWFWFWVILTVILLIGEIFTVGFFLLPFGVGAAVTAAAAWFGLGVVGQWIVFLVVSIPLLLLLKRFAERVTRHREMLNVASDRAVGQTGVVLESVKPYGGGGKVRVGSEEWRAEPEPPEEISKGSLVDVLRVDGTHLVVRPKAASPSPSEGGDA